MATRAWRSEPVRRSRLILVPKPSDQRIDWGIALFWGLIVGLGVVEIGAAVFGFRLFVMWVWHQLEGLL